MEKGGNPETRLLAEKLLVANGCWRRVAHFSLGMATEIAQGQENDTILMCRWTVIVYLSGKCVCAFMCV